MKKTALFIRTFLSAVVLLLSMQVRAFSDHLAAPPDSTTGMIDKSASLVIIEEGKQLYTEGKVRDALIRFRQAAQKDPNTWKAPYWISMCHYRLDNYGFAMQYANQAVALSNETDRDVYELLGKSNHRLGNLDSAMVYYRIAAEKLPKARVRELRILEKIQECEYAKAQLAQKKTFEKKHMMGEVNSGYNDYAPILFNNAQEMYFTSRRSNTTGGKNNPDDDQYFEDIYKAEWNPETYTWDSVTNDLDRLNGPGFDAFSYISPDGLTAFLTLNTTATNTKRVTRSSDICELEFTNKGKWSTPKPISNKSINTSYYDGAATMTADGNTMYFVSDRNGDKTQTDIYVVQRSGKKWGDAKPISDSINTIGRETTPYISPDGRFLFFSSDGHLGMGGYDIYVSENLGSTWSKPVNLGGAFNTVNDDTHFQYYPEWKKAVLSGFSLQGQKASMDLFDVDMTNFVMPKTN
jgi:tetratricopeptide (TPR) repeat protein